MEATVAYPLFQTEIGHTHRALRICSVAYQRVDPYKKASQYGKGNGYNGDFAQKLSERDGRRWRATETLRNVAGNVTGDVLPG